MKRIFLLLLTVAFLASCDNNDDKIIPKDYGMKKFSADMKYDSAGGGMAADFTYKQQTYMKLGQTEPVAIGVYGEDSWTSFHILKQIPNDKDVLVDNPKYNVTTNVKNWDLLFTQYVGNGMKGRGNGVMAYYLTGVLINTARVEVGLYEYENSKDADVQAKAFADLKLEDVANVKYSSEIDFIGNSWKEMVGMPPAFYPKTHYFYIVKTKSGEIYKLRFTGVYGETRKERVFSCEYALLK